MVAESSNKTERAKLLGTNECTWECDTKSPRGSCSPLGNCPKGLRVGERLSDPSSFLACLSPADRLAFHTAVKDSTQDASPITVAVRHNDGRTRWIIGALVTDRDGEISRANGGICDPSEVLPSPQASDALAHDALFERHPVPLLLLDGRTRRIAGANTAAARKFGYSVAELCQKNLYDLRPQADRERVIRALGINPNLVPPVGRYRLCSKTGEVFDVRVAGDLTTLGGWQIWLLAIVDITDRVRAERAARASDLQIRTMFEASPIGIARCDDRGAPVEVNPALLSMLHMDSLKELIPQWPLIRAQVKPEQIARLRAGGNVTTEVRLEVKAGAVIAPGGDESARTFEVVITPLASAEDTTGGYLVQVLDVTENRLMSSQLLRAQRFESLGTLAGGIAHDLNNVLHPIVMSCEEMREDLAGDEQTLELVSVIETSANRGANLVRQLLTFARGASDIRQTVRLADIGAEVASVARETFAKDIDIRVEIAPALWTVSADETQMFQVLTNLCVNARDAMPNGGTLTLAISNEHLDETFIRMHPAAKLGEYVMVTVTDTGTGIPAEAMDRIFDPFFTTKSIGKGTGLGLATSQSITKAHGGFVDVRSTVGVGSSFRVYLPAEPRANERATVRRPPQPELWRGNGELLLVVDDEPALRMVMQARLAAAGYRVHVAADGADAVAQFAQRTEPVHAVITDMMMPVMDGTSTIRVLQRLDPTIRIVVMSGLSAEDSGYRSLASTNTRFLQKPFTIDRVLRALHELRTETPATS